MTIHISADIGKKAIYDDAVFLWQNGKKSSSLLLLFCLIDAFAKKYHPTDANKKRYTKYLKDKIQELERYTSSIRIDSLNKMLPMEDIIYTFYRCNIVHEANDRSDENYEVRMSYDNSEFFSNALFKVDRDNEKLICSAVEIYNLFCKIAESEL